MAGLPDSLVPFSGAIHFNSMGGRDYIATPSFAGDLYPDFFAVFFKNFCERVAVVGFSRAFNSVWKGDVDSLHSRDTRECKKERKCRQKAVNH